MKKIYILWLRQIKRHFRSKSRLFGSLAQPILFLLALGYGFGHIFEQAGLGNYFDFLTPGIIGMNLVFTSVFSGMEVIWDRKFGFLKATLVAPMSRISIMLGRSAGGATVATFQGVVVMLISLLFGFEPQNWLLIIPAIGVMFLISLMFTSFGVMIASLLEDAQGFQLIMNFLIMPMTFLSGAWFPLEGLPKALDIVSSLNPLSYGIDALRVLLIDNGHFGLGVDLTVLAGVTTLCVFLGSYFFRKIQV